MFLRQIALLQAVPAQVIEQRLLLTILYWEIITLVQVDRVNIVLASCSK